MLTAANRKKFRSVYTLLHQRRFIFFNLPALSTDDQKLYFAAGMLTRPEGPRPRPRTLEAEAWALEAKAWTLEAEAAISGEAEARPQGLTSLVGSVILNLRWRSLTYQRLAWAWTTRTKYSDVCLHKFFVKVFIPSFVFHYKNES